MLVKKSLVGLLIINSITVFSLTSCGNGYYDNYPEATYYQYVLAQATKNTPSISPSACSCTCPVSTVTPTINKSSALPATTTITSPNPTTTATPTTNTTEDKGRKALDKVLAYLVSGNAFEAVVQKYEKDLLTNKEQNQKIKLIGKKPNRIKLEVLEHNNPNTVGAKVSFFRGSGKAMVRPGGVLKFITKELNMNDSNIVTPNNYTPEKVDLFALNERFSQSSYKAEISGKTTLEGKEIYLLKITNANNDLDPRISYEIIGFDPNTFQPLLWEGYTSTSTNAYMRTVIKSFSILSDIPDTSFNV